MGHVPAMTEPVVEPSSEPDVEPTTETATEPVVALFAQTMRFAQTSRACMHLDLGCIL